MGMFAPFTRFWLNLAWKKFPIISPKNLQARDYRKAKMNLE